MKIVRRSKASIRNVAGVHQVAIHIMLHDEARGVKPSNVSNPAYIRIQWTKHAPIIKDLASHDVPSNTPTVLVAFLAKPVVAQNLGVEIDRLKRGVVDVRLGALEEEEAVVIHRLRASI